MVLAAARKIHEARGATEWLAKAEPLRIVTRHLHSPMARRVAEVFQKVPLVCGLMRAVGQKTRDARSVG